MRLSSRPKRSEVGLLLLFYPSDLTAPNRSNHPPLVIPSAAEGPAVRPGSRTKFSIPLVLPQNRHPERSASQSYRVIQRLWRGVEGPRRCLSYPCCSELFNHRARSGRPFGLCLGPRGWKMLKRFTVAIQCESQQILWSGFGGRKAPSSRGKISTAEVLRLRATSAVSHDNSARRSAQDDDSVGELTERRTLCGSRGAPQVPGLRSPRIPVEICGVDALHAPFFAERRTRGPVQCYVAGIRVGMTISFKT
jgi:hypothetical protein